MTSIVARTLIIYIFLSFMLRIMGKRQLGELEVSELVSTLLVSEIASLPIDNPDIPLLNAIIPIALIVSIEVILSTIKNKSERLKKTIEGEPEYIIYKGRLLQNALRDNRMSVNELLSQLRAQGVGSIDEVYYAAVEKSGSLSVLKRGESDLAHTIIIDGNVIVENLNSLGYNEIWLEKRLKERSAKREEIFLMTVTDDGQIGIIMKDRDRE